jgi:phage host-nuclease inhibitor protein Gam
MDKYLEECADLTLRNIKYTADRITNLEQQAETEMAAIREKYKTEIELLKWEFDCLDKEIVFLMKQNAGPLFDGRDKISLVNGILIFAKESKVSLPKDALSRLEKAGFTEGIKISKSVDRGAIAKWTDERLFIIGASRKLIQKFAYEIKDE